MKLVPLFDRVVLKQLPCTESYRDRIAEIRKDGQTFSLPAKNMNKQPFFEEK